MGSGSSISALKLQVQITSSDRMTVTKYEQGIVLRIYEDGNVETVKNWRIIQG